MKPFLTVGMAHVEDFNGVFMTIQSIRQNNNCEDIEFVVVHNGGGNQHANEVYDFLTRKINNQDNAGCRFVHMPDPRGTSAPRDRVFKEARGEYTIVMDSHVIWPGAKLRPDGTYCPAPFDALKDHFRKDPDTLDLFSGPIQYDSLNIISTHFDDFWRSEMLGIWGWAWRCPCDYEKGLRFSTHQVGSTPVAAYALSMGMVQVTHCSECGKYLPDDLSDSNLKIQGYLRMGVNRDEPKFEIPGTGLWAFACRTDAWLGFNEHARGFGGEELYIHEKFRNAGRKCWCLPFLQGDHRYSKMGTGHYPVTLWNKVRNYVLESNEIGYPSLEDIHKHFVLETKRMPQSEWDYLIEDPIKHTEEPKRPDGPKSSGWAQPAMDTASTDSLYAWMLESYKAKSRDLDKHMPKLRELASNCEHITEIATRREGSVAFAATNPKKLVSYNMEAADGVFTVLRTLMGDALVLESKKSTEVESIEETDLLFIDSIHTWKVLQRELELFAPKVRKYIVLHDTKGNGEKGEDGKEGLFYALRPWLESHGEWFPVYHTDMQYGLTVLSKDITEFPAVPVNPNLIGFGPGTELKMLLRSWGVNPSPGCLCNKKVAEMDSDGVDGCRRKKSYYVDIMQRGQKDWGWDSVLKAAITAMQVEPALCARLALHILNPWPTILDEVISRAEVKQQKINHAQQKALKRMK